MIHDEPQRHATAALARVLATYAGRRSGPPEAMADRHLVAGLVEHALADPTVTERELLEVAVWHLLVTTYVAGGKAANVRGDVFTARFAEALQQPAAMRLPGKMRERPV